MEERYLCKIRIVNKADFGKPRECLYGATIEYVWFDEKADFHRGMYINKHKGTLEPNGSPELHIYHGLRDMLTWLIANNLTSKHISVYVESKKVVNQLGPKQSRLLSTYDYNDMAKQCRSIVALFQDISFHQVGFESLAVQQEVADRG